MQLIVHALTAFLIAGAAPLGQTPEPLPTGRLVVETIHFAALEDTVTGEDPNRTVAVYLPPSYFTERERRFPTLYLLHGIGDTETVWTRAWNEPDDPWGTVARLLDRGIAAGRLAEMMVVMPDGKSRAGGSFYADSKVSGHWEELIVGQLPAWVDRRYRTLARAESRGIAGHSMGGYGAIMAGMKHPDVFSAVYAMNPATLGWGADVSHENPAFGTVLERGGWNELKGFYEYGVIAIAQAFSPNPQKPPFFVDFPFRPDAGGTMIPAEPAHSQWEEHFPLVIAHRYRDHLLRLRGLRFDTGNDDEYTHIPPTTREFSRLLTDLEVPHVFEEYNGDHRNRLWGRTGRLYTEVLPWFSLLLDPQAASAAGGPGAEAAEALLQESLIREDTPHRSPLR